MAQGNPFEVIGKGVLLVGLLLVATGLILILGPKVPWLGKLPGDIVIKKDGLNVFFPITTCLLLSGFIALIFFIINILKK